MKKRKIVTLSVVIIVIALLLEASILKYVNDINAYRTSKVLIDRVITVLNKNDKSKNELIVLYNIYIFQNCKRKIGKRKSDIHIKYR